MEKLESFIEDYDCSEYARLPKFMKRRVDALKKIQLEQIQIQHQYHQELQELELKYDKLYQPLYDRRAEIISGAHTPTDEECQLPANIVENEFNGDNDENATGEAVEPLLSEEEESLLSAKVKGLPGFWLGCLLSTYNFSESIEQHDKRVLKHLQDIKLSYDLQEDFLQYKFEFFFEDNPHFTNKVLTKSYHLRLKPDEKDPFSYDGFEVTKSEGCEINWNPGKDVTTKTVTVKQQNKTDGRVREKKKEVERDSFFYFFKPPEVPSNEDDIDMEWGAIMAVDFELGEVLRLSIIPKAPLYYNGYMREDDDDDDEDDEDDEDSDSDGFDYDSDLDESDESNDSLNAAGKSKKKLIKSPKKEK